MAEKVASLYGLLALDDRDFVRGMDNADKRYDTLADKMDRFGARFSRVGIELTAITDPLKNFGLQGIEVAANFEDTMTEISARTGLVGKDLEAISDAALQMGADTAFSGQQAAEAFLQLLTSGQTAEEALKTLPHILDAAAASGEDLGATADTITDIMAAFGLEVDDTANVVDVLARAAGASSADMASLGQGFGNVGGVARQFGLSVDDTAAILAVFSENGIKGAEAGTTLKSMLLNMTRPTEDVQKAWDKLGVSFYDAQGAARPINDVMSDLKTALDPLPAEEQNEIMMQLAGSYGIVGLTALTGSMSIDDMKTSMQEATGAAEVADARMGTFNGVIDSLKGSVETLQTEALQPFIDMTLRPMAQHVTDVVNSITGWVKENPELANTIVQVLAGLVVLGPVLMGIGAVISSVGTIVGALSGAFMFLLSPVGLAIAAAVALGAAYMTNFGGIRDFIDTQVRPKIEEFFTFLGQVWEQVRPALEAFAAWFITDGLPAVAEFITGTVVPAVQDFFNWVSGVWALVSPALTEFFNWFTVTGLPAIETFITGTVVPAVEDLFNFIRDIWTTVSPGLTELFNWFTQTGLPGVITILEDAWTAANQIVEIIKAWLDQNPTLFDSIAKVGVIVGVTTGLYLGFHGAVLLINTAQAIMNGLWVGGTGIAWALSTGLYAAAAGMAAYVASVAAAVAPFALIAAAILGMVAAVENFNRVTAEAKTMAQQTVAEGLASGKFNEKDVQDQAFKSIAGQFGGGIFGDVLARATYSNVANTIMPEKRAEGGPVSSGKPYLVGEEGPELFMPRSSGTIVPNGAMGGESLTVQNVNVYANSSAEGAAAAEGFNGRLKELRRAQG